MLMREPARHRNFRAATGVGGAMGDNHGNRRSFELRHDEIEAQAIAVLERARMLPPGARRHELLKEAGRLRMQVMVQRLTGEAPGVGATSPRLTTNLRRRDRL